MTVAVSIDGVLTPPESATISIFDRGLLYGDGLFEVLRTWDGRTPTLADHLARLYASATALQLRAMPRDPLAASVQRTVAAAGPGDHRVKILLTRGPGPLTARLAELGPGRAIVVVEPLPEPPRELVLAVVDAPMLRRPAHKTLAYLDHVLARELAGGAEAVRLDPEGNVVECATSNIFAVIGGVVTTPPVDSGALPGVTRKHVLACCVREALPAIERRLPLSDLRHADEVFVTSALRGVVPVTRLDDRKIDAGAVTARIAGACAQAMRALL